MYGGHFCDTIFGTKAFLATAFGRTALSAKLVEERSSVEATKHTIIV
jgi:hypothetical protein